MTTRQETNRPGRRELRGPERLEAMILVGGKGTRLRSVVSDRPKPMADVAGRPFVGWLLSSLRSQGIRRIVLCTGYLGELIEEYLGDGRAWDMDLEYSRDPFPLGTGGAVRHALPRMRGRRFLVLNGDSYCRFDLSLLTSVHERRNARATLWLVKAPDCRRYGSVVLDADGKVQSFVEKASASAPGWVNAGVYLIDRDAIEPVANDCPFSLEADVFPALIGKGLYAVAAAGSHLDIGTPESYAAAQEFLGQEVQA